MTPCHDASQNGLSLSRCLPHDTLEPILEPLDRLLLIDAVRGADRSLAASTPCDTLAWTGPVIHISDLTHIVSCARCHIHAAVEVHAVDTDRGVVLNAQIDVLGDTEAEVARLAEVALPQLVLLDLETALEDLLCLGAADGDVDGDLLVTADTEGTDGVAGLAWRAPLSARFQFVPTPAPLLQALYWDKHTVDWRLTAQLLQHLRRSCQSITGLAHRDVENELLNAELAHGVGGLLGSALCLDVLAIGLLSRGLSFGLYIMSG